MSRALPFLMSLADSRQQDRSLRRRRALPSRDISQLSRHFPLRDRRVQSCRRERPSRKRLPTLLLCVGLPVSSSFAVFFAVTRIETDSALYLSPSFPHFPHCTHTQRLTSLIYTLPTTSHPYSLFGVAMFKALGLGGGCSLLAGASILMIPAIWVSSIPLFNFGLTARRSIC